MEDNSYLVEDMIDRDEQAQLISDMASHGQNYLADGEFFKHKKQHLNNENFSTKPDKSHY